MASQGAVLVPRNVHIMDIPGTGRRNRPVNVGLTGRTNSTYWGPPPRETSGDATVTARISFPPTTTHVQRKQSGDRTVLPPPSRISRREPSRERLRGQSREHPRRPKPPSPPDVKQQDGAGVAENTTNNNNQNQSPPPTRGTQRDTGCRLNEIYELWKTDSYRDEARADGRKKLTPLATASRVLDPTGLTEESMEWLQGYTEEEERRQAVMKKCSDWVNSLPNRFPAFCQPGEKDSEPISALPPIIERE
ncbi:uncharacterized protein LOC118420371 [Branchiostoma floridae]|uniref:Uncharacterized protein LOC118420371 n=1 Tax=Branchiostoma floridae TaxID=7739 RepID=C3YS71_BRAFL|nr:uncharacterized protein LOC118420371 [Branchiostoma floridae]|eukprot:XP_002600964.1 hypothetical protein BRAFLDRAFT_122262 [Branchiostoma floridae]